MSWHKWDTYLGKKYERPLPKGGTTKRVVRLSDGKGSIGLKLHYTYCVIFHQDGTVTYNTGGWNTVTTKRFINEYGPVRVFSEKGNLRLWVSDPEVTPPKIQKCRSGCKGSGQVPNECYGPSWCYPRVYGGSEPCEHGETRGHRREQCEHGQSASHPDGMRACSRCDGAGQVDYGSKRIYPEWEGDAYRFDPDNAAVQIIEPHAPYDPPSSPVVSTGGESYGNSGTILGKLMPDIRSSVAYPCLCHRHETAAVTTVVIHLNDNCKWTRERIADWLDTLDLNLRFPTP